MRIALIAAMAENRVIGRHNRLPWRLSADLQRFKALTLGKPVLMGRKTYESIGRPLPDRINIVITRDTAFEAEGCQVVHSVDQALMASEGHPEILVMGGADLYRQMLADADRLYLTLVKAEVEGDTWFPEFEWQDWRELEREPYQADAKNEYDFEWVVLERIR